MIERVSVRIKGNVYQKMRACRVEWFRDFGIEEKTEAEIGGHRDEKCCGFHL